MTRDNRVRLSDEELSTVKQARTSIYVDKSMPMGVVIKRACEMFMAHNDSNEVSF